MKRLVLISFFLFCADFCPAAAVWYTPDSTFYLTIPDGWTQIRGIPEAIRARSDIGEVVLLLVQEKSNERFERLDNPMPHDLPIPFMLVKMSSIGIGNTAWPDFRTTGILDTLTLCMQRDYKIDFDFVGVNDSNRVATYRSGPIDAPKDSPASSKTRYLIHVCWGRNSTSFVLCYEYDSTFAQVEPIFVSMADGMSFAGATKVGDESIFTVADDTLFLVFVAICIVGTIWLLVKVFWRKAIPDIIMRWRWGIAVSIALAVAIVEFTHGCRQWDQVLSTNTVLCLAIAQILGSRSKRENVPASSDRLEELTFEEYINLRGIVTVPLAETEAHKSSRQALEEILVDWRSRPDILLDTTQKEQLRRLVPRLRADLTKAEWLSIAKMIADDRHADLRDYARKE